MDTFQILIRNITAISIGTEANLFSVTWEVLVWPGVCEFEKVKLEMAVVNSASLWKCLLKYVLEQLAEVRQESLRMRIMDLKPWQTVVPDIWNGGMQQ
jgi:hypothetical protein